MSEKFSSSRRLVTASYSAVQYSTRQQGAGTV